MQQRRYTLLVVDDEQQMRSTLESYFSKRNFLVQTAQDGEEAWQKVQAQEFDVAIVDIRMPRLDGIELAQRIRKDGYDTSIIIITGHGDRDEAIKALNIGVDRWVDKSSLDMGELHEIAVQLAEGVSLDQVKRILSVLPKSLKDMDRD
ncbi:MAG: response regulator [Anaerolineae bacterium]|nr:response regulator [Anaerolineae bacterium]MDW8172788.1 response regulator [Anaerolineae bacterium]